MIGTLLPTLSLHKTRCSCTGVKKEKQDGNINFITTAQYGRANGNYAQCKHGRGTQTQGCFCGYHKSFVNMKGKKW